MVVHAKNPRLAAGLGRKMRQLSHFVVQIGSWVGIFASPDLAPRAHQGKIVIGMLLIQNKIIPEKTNIQDMQLAVVPDSGHERSLPG